jgi:hypothetical protein
MDAAPVVIGGRAMVPIRLIAETLGADVHWDQATGKITISKREVRADEPDVFFASLVGCWAGIWSGWRALWWRAMTDLLPAMALAATLILTRLVKGLPGISKIPTQAVSYVLAALVLLGASLVAGRATAADLTIPLSTRRSSAWRRMGPIPPARE